MAEREPVPDADAQEQSRSLTDEDPGDVDDIPPGVPEADALEQARPGARVVGEIDPTRLRLPPDVPEADALDQARPVEDEDDYEQ